MTCAVEEGAIMVKSPQARGLVMDVRSVRRRQRAIET